MDSPSRPRSPIKTVTSTRSTTFRDDNDDRTNEKSEETYNREVTEKKTTILNEPEVSGNKETYKKTTITEKEETIQKTEILKFTQIGGCPDDSTSNNIDPLKLFEERRNQRRNERAAAGITSSLKNSNNSLDQKTTTTSVTKTVKFGDGEAQKLSEFNHSNKSSNKSSKEQHTTNADDNDCRLMGSPSKFGSCRDRSNSPPKRHKSEIASTECSLSSPTKMESFTSSSQNTSSPSKWSPNKDDINYVFNTTVADDEESVLNNTKQTRDIKYSEDDWNVASAGNRKRRLKNLASKFHD